MTGTARIASAFFAVAALAGLTACGSDKDSTPAASTATPSSVQVRPVVPATAAQFTVTTPDATTAFPADFYAGSFGCTAANRAPHLAWIGAPAAAKSFAVTMFDPDAPTGAGFWHWMTWDIPSTAKDFTAGTAGVAGPNDAGVPGYLGPCPPAGDKPHTYQISVLALDTPSLELPAATTPTVASFSMGAHIIGVAHLNLTAQR